MQVIAYGSHSHLVSKAGSVIALNTDKLRHIAFIIAAESHSIMNTKLPSLSVNYSSVY